MAENEPNVRTRRPPPPFRTVAVSRIENLTPHMVRVTFAGPELEGFTVERPAASVRLLLPMPGEVGLVIPAWNGNEFLMSDGRRPIIRTFTPRSVRPLELDLDIVLHETGAASDWARKVAPGDPAGISGPGRGYVVDPEATGFVLIGDETAIPAIAQLLEWIPGACSVVAHLEAGRPDARMPLPDHPQGRIVWHDLPAGDPPGDTLVQAVHDIDLAPGILVWAAGEAAAMQRIRRHLSQQRDLPRRRATVRGYWKYGRGGDPGED